jgi:hypothetical protein
MSKSNTRANQVLDTYFDKLHTEAAKDDWAPDLKDRVLKISRPKRVYEILLFSLVGAGIIAAIAMLTAREDPNAPPMMIDSPAVQSAQSRIGE